MTPTNKIEMIFCNEIPDIKYHISSCKNNGQYYIYYDPYCSECAEKNNDKEMKLLIVNSPRSGECCYE